METMLKFLLSVTKLCTYSNEKYIKNIWMTVKGLRTVDTL